MSSLNDYTFEIGLSAALSVPNVILNLKLLSIPEWPGKRGDNTLLERSSLSYSTLTMGAKRASRKALMTREA